MDVTLDQLKIEVATEDDEQAVLSIRKPQEVYGGTDYLPDTFKSLINFPNSTGYVVIHEEKCIAFTLVTIFDEDETYIVRAVRIAKQYEGKGIIKWFLDKIDDIAKATSTVKYRVSVSLRVDVPTKRRLEEGRCYTVSNRELVPFINETDVQILKAKLEANENNLQKIDVIDKSELSNVLESARLTNGKNGQKLVVNMIPFRPIKSNASFIMQETTLVIGSNLKNADCSLVTFGFSYEAFVGTVVFIDICGKFSNDLKHHIMFHLKHVLKHCNGKSLMLKLLYDSDTSNTNIEKMMKTCGFAKKKSIESGIWCVETRI